jgi:hypothetical protein
VLLMSLGGGIDAAELPPPVSARCKITCVVDGKAEWTTYGPPFRYFPSAAPYIQTSDSTPVLIINSNHESMLEMNSDGTFYSGNFPVDIIVLTTSVRRAESQEDNLVKTITVCWKI